jgi:hypothetical protein
MTMAMTDAHTDVAPLHASPIEKFIFGFLRFKSKL